MAETNWPLASISILDRKDEAGQAIVVFVADQRYAVPYAGCQDWASCLGCDACREARKLAWSKAMMLVERVAGSVFLASVAAMEKEAKEERSFEQAPG